MPQDWPSEHLQIIRTLMERTAVYRRALTPASLLIGGLGFVAAGVAWMIPIGSPQGFSLFWMAVGSLGVLGGLAVIRRQALHDREPVWSPPARRVAQAFAPCFLAGLFLGLLHSFSRTASIDSACGLSAIWMILYGCGLHAAGFFMPRGIKLLGWLFLIAGGGWMLSWYGSGGVGSWNVVHAGMGGTFGGLHLFYGTYLFFTETKADDA